MTGEPFPVIAPVSPPDHPPARPVEEPLGAGFASLGSGGVSPRILGTFPSVHAPQSPADGTDTAPGPAEPGHNVPADTAPGGVASGDVAPGDVAPGDAAFGPTVHGTAGPGTVAVPSSDPVLGLSALPASEPVTLQPAGPAPVVPQSTGTEPAAADPALPEPGASGPASSAPVSPGPVASASVSPDRSAPAGVPGSEDTAREPALPDAAFPEAPVSAGSAPDGSAEPPATSDLSLADGEPEASEATGTPADVAPSGSQEVHPVLVFFGPGSFFPPIGTMPGRLPSLPSRRMPAGRVRPEPSAPVPTRTAARREAPASPGVRPHRIEHPDRAPIPDGGPQWPAQGTGPEPAAAPFSEDAPAFAADPAYAPLPAPGYDDLPPAPGARPVTAEFPRVPEPEAPPPVADVPFLRPTSGGPVSSHTPDPARAQAAHAPLPWSEPGQGGDRVRQVFFGSSLQPLLDTLAHLVTDHPQPVLPRGAGGVQAAPVMTAAAAAVSRFASATTDLTTVTVVETGSVGVQPPRDGADRPHEADAAGAFGAGAARGPDPAFGSASAAVPDPGAVPFPAAPVPNGLPFADEIWPAADQSSGADDAQAYPPESTAPWTGGASADPFPPAAPDWSAGPALSGLEPGPSFDSVTFPEPGSRPPGASPAFGDEADYAAHGPGPEWGGAPAAFQEAPLVPGSAPAPEFAPEPSPAPAPAPAVKAASARAVAAPARTGRKIAVILLVLLGLGLAVVAAGAVVWSLYGERILATLDVAVPGRTAALPAAPAGRAPGLPGSEATGADLVMRAYLTPAEMARLRSSTNPVTSLQAAFAEALAGMEDRDTAVRAAVALTGLSREFVDSNLDTLHVHIRPGDLGRVLRISSVYQAILPDPDAPRDVRFVEALRSLLGQLGRDTPATLSTAPVAGGLAIR